MNRKGKAYLSLAGVLVLIAVLAVVSIFGIGPKHRLAASSIKKGLDLAGGVSITYQTVKEDPTQEEMSDLQTKFQLRADIYSTESAVYQEGSNRINVDIPGADDAERILEELGKAGAIYFVYGTDNITLNAEKTGYELTKTMEELEEQNQIVLTGADIVDARATTQPTQTGGKENVVVLTLNTEGAKKFAEATTASIGKLIAIVYDQKVISAPRVSVAITNGEAVISGQSTHAEAESLASTIRIGALPLEMVEVRSQVVGAQLGEEAIQTSLLAAGIGLICVVVFMIVMYRIPGVAASLALSIYVGIMILALNLLDVTLTLQGMAGIILSIGMAVDANVIIFQRIREELGTGKTVRSAMKIGFHKALSAIVDGNVTTLIAAAVLFVLASGGVKGFAITLAIGILLSMFTALTVTRFILNALYDIGFDREGMYGIQKERKVLPFIKHAPRLVLISLALIAAGFISMGVHAGTGESALNYGLDFKGGTSLSVTFPEGTADNLNTELEQLVAETIGETSEIVRVTGETTYIIKTAELDKEERAAVTAALVERYGVEEELIMTENISGRVSSEMRSSAVKAVLAATVCMLIYIWVRFKNFNFATSAVIALIHDVLIVLTVYAVARISVGNTFIACMLTIVGYSINATIVIFDRIRENMAEKKNKDSIADVVNASITQTFSRSVNTSLTTLFMVLMLAILGVDSIKEFAIPLLAGIVGGAFSSICITGSLWYFFETKLHRPKKAAKSADGES